MSLALKRSAQAQQEGGQVHSYAIGMNEGMRVLSYLIAGVGLYGGLGWLADRLLGTGFGLPVGIVLGAAIAAYVIIRRFGGFEATTETVSDAANGEGAR
ncbi:MAG: AtpZ/AtpI family protein [Microlunatus sp.]|nr:AtpZ/AtpI family protein [Microlunatus sp.]